MRWSKVAQTLQPFAASPELRENKSRDKALFMAGQSAFKSGDYAGGLVALQALLRDYPKFEGYEEAAVFAARGYVETKNWGELQLAYKNFIADFPKSDRRARMDFYAAKALAAQGKPGAAPALKSLAQSETYEDVRADAYYEWALMSLQQNPADLNTAFDALDKSVKFLARADSLVDLGRAAFKLQNLDAARDALTRAIREFPNDPRRAEAETLFAEVQKQLAKDKVDVLSHDKEEAGSGDNKKFTINTDDNISQLESGDEYRTDEKFAAAVPLCGAGDPGKADVLKDMPVWIFHGDKDSIVSVKGSREMFQALLKARGEQPETKEDPKRLFQSASNGRLRFTEYKGGGHNSAWDNGLVEPDLIGWVFEQSLSKTK